MVWENYPRGSVGMGLGTVYGPLFQAQCKQQLPYLTAEQQQIKYKEQVPRVLRPVPSLETKKK